MVRLSSTAGRYLCFLEHRDELRLFRGNSEQSEHAGSSHFQETVEYLRREEDSTSFFFRS